LKPERPVAPACDGAMIPVFSPELLTAAVELMCYFCTAIGVAVTFFLIPRG
jgi:hypothetical protein